MTHAVDSAHLRLVLASASPRRAALLARLGLRPVVRPPEIDETPRPGEDAAEMVRRLATAKAGAVATRNHGDDEVVLAADTAVVLDGRALGKPADRDEAAAMLRVLSGRRHRVLTAVAVQRGEQRHRTLVATGVHVRSLSESEVAWYLATGEPDDKAGGYALQGAGAALIARIDGSDTNVIGLPLAETVELLRRVGLDPLRPVPRTTSP